MKLNFAFRITLFSTLNLLIFCQVNNHDVNSSILKEVVKGSNEFALKLLRFLGSHPGEVEKNFFVSPISIVLALGMVFLGADKDSAQQITDTLNWSGLKRQDIYRGMKILQETLLIRSEETLQLKLANRVWGHENLQLKNSFANNMKDIYNSVINLKDFGSELDETREEINQWVYEQTNGKITEFFPLGMLTHNTKLTLVNAIYFKGLWKYQFNEQKTFLAPFYAFGKRQNEQVVKMMSMTAKLKYFRDEVNACKIVQLSYNGEHVSMLLLLPEQLDGLTKFEQTLTNENLERWMGHLIETKVSVSIPKFKFNQELDLKHTLPHLGIIDIFDASKANLLGISESDDLLVSSAIHKAYLDVNEKGTEAAAASGVVMAKRSLDMNEVFHVDHPFLFLIYHHSSYSILFLGRVVKMDDIVVKGKIVTESKKHPSDEL